jgi:hypothetical protein
LWFRLLLVIVLAVTLSTYLSGVISFLTTMFLYLAGLIVDFQDQHRQEEDHQKAQEQGKSPFVF